MEIIKAGDKEKSAICRMVLESLPDWFGIKQAREKYISTVTNMPMFCAVKDRESIGFASVKVHNHWNGEIYVMGVLPQLHRKGVGIKLVQTVEAYLCQQAVQLMTVKTVSEGSHDKNYAMTRKFYSACKFESFEEFPDLWGEDNPCLLMVKQVNLVEPAIDLANVGRRLRKHTMQR